MRRLAFIAALAIACGPQAAGPSASPAASPSPSLTPSQSASPSPTAPLVLRDLSVVAAGEVRDHVLVATFEDAGQPDGSGASRIWDVPLDGSPARSIVAYTRGARAVTGYFPFDLSRQLAPDGRRLVLADPSDIAGRGLVVIDLVAGTTRVIPLPEMSDQPSWSPDGTRIAYRGFTLQGPLPRESGLWVVDASGGAPRRVWTNTGSDRSVATVVYGWTEDGAGLAVSESYADLGVVDIATGALKRFSAPVHGIAWRAKRPSVVMTLDQDVPLPSPTGPRGAPGNVGRPGRVDVRDTTLAAPRTVFEHPDRGSLLWDPRWSPASDDVLMRWVCGAGAGGPPQLVVVNAVTRAVRDLPIEGCAYATAWSGDGTRVLYSDISSVRVMKADGSGVREIFRPARQSGSTPSVGAIFAFAPH
jgi:Tol biopolymer transport system component